MAGPQLVVPATVPRYALNAANARWGSLYDALYGTDALPLDHELAPGYDVRRGAQVIAEADRLLDLYFPLVDGSHADVTAYQVDSPGRLTVQTAQGVTGLVDPAQFVAHRRVPAGDALGAVLLRRHGLHVELAIDTVDAGRDSSTTRGCPTSWWSRRSRRSWTWRTRLPRSTGRTRSAPTAPGSGCERAG